MIKQQKNKFWTNNWKYFLFGAVTIIFLVIGLILTFCTNKENVGLFLVGIGIGCMVNDLIQLLIEIKRHWTSCNQKQENKCKNQ